MLPSRPMRDGWKLGSTPCRPQPRWLAAACRLEGWLPTHRMPTSSRIFAGNIGRQESIRQFRDSFFSFPRQSAMIQHACREFRGVWDFVPMDLWVSRRGSRLDVVAPSPTSCSPARAAEQTSGGAANQVREEIREQPPQPGLVSRAGMPAL